METPETLATFVQSSATALTTTYLDLFQGTILADTTGIADPIQAIFSEYLGLAILTINGAIKDGLDSTPHPPNRSV